jgi:hypothetical protein
MKLKTIAKLGLVSVLSFSACQKSNNKNDCDLGGGIVSPNTYLFWVDHDFGGGAITVEVKDDQGKVVPPYQNTTSYIAVSAPACNNTNYNKYATFDLYPGKTYKYHAVCSGKTWDGTIGVPCEQNQCKNIQLQ